MGTMGTMGTNYINQLLIKTYNGNKMGTKWEQTGTNGNTYTNKDQKNA